MDTQQITDKLPKNLGQGDSRLWPVVAGGAAALAAFGARSAVKTGWKSVRDEDPPRNPADPETSWTDALLWALAIGVTVGLARLVALRGTAAAWTKATGDRPPIDR